MDALGAADTYEYNRDHRMSATTVKTGVRFYYAYGDSGRCIKTGGTDGLYEIALRADPKARTTAVEGEEPRVYTWNDDGLMTREALPDGTVIEERAYDDDLFLVAEANGAGAGAQHWYDARGNRIRSVDAGGGVTATEYYDSDLPLRRVTPDGLVTRFTHDDKRGALTGMILPSGQTYSLTYDERGRLTGIYSAHGLVSGFEYDAHHNVAAEIDARGARTTYTYDGLGRALTHTDALGRTTRVRYDTMGRPLGVVFPDGSKTTMSRDAAGNVVREVDPLGRTTSMGYSGMGVLAWLKDPEGREWIFEYTSKERLRSIKNPRGEVYSFTRDDAGRVIQEKTFDGRELWYYWNAAGKLREIHHPDKSWRVFGYDRRGLVVSERASDGSTVSYGRDRVGRLLAAVIEEDGQRVETLFERDALGRVVLERQGDRAIRYGYDARGRRAVRVMPDGATTRYAYDAADALEGVEHGGVRLAIERDVLGREFARRNAAIGLSIQSGYDAMDRLIEQRATAPSPGDDVPRLLVTRRWERDEGGRVTRIDDARWGATAYRYSRGEDLVEATRGAHREVFAYDGAGALVQALGGLDARASAGESASWWRGTDSPPWTVAPGNMLRQTDRARYASDARGRRVGKLEAAAAGADPKASEGERTTTYGWDVRDRLREVKLSSGERVRMTYDALGRRVRKQVIAATGDTDREVAFLWDGDAIAAELDSAQGVRCFVHEPGTLVPLLQAERGGVFTYVNDHLGTPKELIDSKGMVAWSAAHSAWGKVIDSHGDPICEMNHGAQVSSPFRLLGQYADEETGLCSTRFRYFDSEVGRWLSPDPLGLFGGFELFGFDGCAVNESDPLGLSTTGNPHEHDLPSKLLKDPKSIWGKSAQEIADAFENAGYKATMETSTKGSKRSTQVRIAGHPEISNIQVHPGGGRHEGAYYKISTSTQGKIKVVDPDTYVPTQGEKATIIPYK
ncbi:RHS repeat-associated core domain-containing protein [Sorangium sp. So ce269]